MYVLPNNWQKADIFMYSASTGLINYAKQHTSAKDHTKH